MAHVPSLSVSWVCTSSPAHSVSLTCGLDDVPMSCPPCPACCILGSWTCLYPRGSHTNPAPWAVGVHGAGASLGWEILHPREAFFGDPKCCKPQSGEPQCCPHQQPLSRGKLWLERDGAAAALAPSKLEPAALGQVAEPRHPPVTTTVHMAFAEQHPCQAGWVPAHMEPFASTAPPLRLELGGGSSKAGVLVWSPCCRHWWLLNHLPQQSPAPVGCSSTARSRVTSSAQAVVPCKAAWGFHMGVFHLQSTPCTHFHAHASPACLGGLDIAAPSHSPAGTGTQPSSMLERGKEVRGMHSQHGTGCGTEGNPTGQGPAGTCQTQPPPLPCPPGPALAPVTPTSTHHSRRHLPLGTTSPC